jgi:hypothetical protein
MASKKGSPILWSIGGIRNLVDVQVAGVGGQNAASFRDDVSTSHRNYSLVIQVINLGWIVQSWFSTRVSAINGRYQPLPAMNDQRLFNVKEPSSKGEMVEVTRFTTCSGWWLTYPSETY